MDKTQSTYEKEDFVQLYIDANSEKEVDINKAENFARRLHPGSKVLDLGCGPGHLSYVIANATNVEGDSLNHQVLGGDYSEEMIKRAKTLKTQTNMPEFVVSDMYKLAEDFGENEFEDIFANASLLHVPEEKIIEVLKSIVKITKDGGLVFINLKQGKPESQTVVEEKAGMKIEREFTFWEGEDFSNIAKGCGLELEEFYTEEFASTSGTPTVWLNYYFRVSK